MNNKIKPGDLFEWVYKHNNSPVWLGEHLYSYIMNKYIPCDGLCLCVGINDNIIYWFSDNGLFYGEIGITISANARHGRSVIQRKIQS